VDTFREIWGFISPIRGNFNGERLGIVPCILGEINGIAEKSMKLPKLLIDLFWENLGVKLGKFSPAPLLPL